MCRHPLFRVSYIALEEVEAGSVPLVACSPIVVVVIWLYLGVSCMEVIYKVINFVMIKGYPIEHETSHSIDMINSLPLSKGVRGRSQKVAYSGYGVSVPLRYATSLPSESANDLGVDYIYSPGADMRTHSHL